ncbi:spermatogenesis associated 6-like protein [Anarrhichthys ocellatus]|uniref:spermatogenesis associated 6-like protein n=1 Tax=Anarrhichthys ocellatus TaxID=433405 RepID=UPI0012EE6E80|nr:spermatogenesis associated 6-like protein [Anarrhichthys ocellatus]
MEVIPMVALAMNPGSSSIHGNSIWQRYSRRRVRCIQITLELILRPMARKALKVLVELKFRAVSCPGVHLPAKDDIYLSMCFMGQYCQSECLPAVFPLLFHERMTFEKIFRHAVDPGDIAVMLEYETVSVELLQLIPPAADTLACFEEDARRFLFPEPKLVPSSSGVDREVLMTRAPHFPGIAPRLEFSTKTTIIECSADAEINIYPNVPMRPVIKRSRKHSLSPLRAGDTQRLARLSLDSAAPGPANWDTRSSSQPQLDLQACSLRHHSPVADPSASPQRSTFFTSSSSPLTRSSSKVRYSPAGRRKSSSNGLVGGISEDDSSSSEIHEPLAHHQGPDPSGLWCSYREQARHSRSQSSSDHREWEEVQARVRGLLTTPKAVRRLACGATHSEVDEVLARRSISPGPP